MIVARRTRRREIRKNPARRAALLDAAIEVLAREGARGLTQRAVDAEAAVPTGTTSNYFRDRDDLLIQAGVRVYERLDPGEDALAEALSRARDSASYSTLLRETLHRVTAFPTGHLAMLELRLEAIRRPALRALLTERVRADIDGSVARHRAAGLPGGATDVQLLYLAMNWLVVERLTLPGVLTEAECEALITRVAAMLPDTPA
ncbi:TetR/AcrR family transcriptional regulator [Streptomyces sp. RFCAC02]|uniref:TetR/AcrR family transcriptional regulator n=1 Tax=Streptomyces sp. RFCAC02 TaxID=2499143 RepID=UPI001F0DEC91|nr:TetR/AcrR family transcriptional regulator [Streptomyces sp. RFCAC02]